MLLATILHGKNEWVSEKSQRTTRCFSTFKIFEIFCQLLNINIYEAVQRRVLRCISYALYTVIVK